MNVFQKIWFLLGNVMEWLLITMTGVSIMGCVAAAIQNRLDMILPLSICATAFYGLVKFNRKTTWFILRCCGTTK